MLQSELMTSVLLTYLADSQNLFNHWEKYRMYIFLPLLFQKLYSVHFGGI